MPDNRKKTGSSQPPVSGPGKKYHEPTDMDFDREMNAALAAEDYDRALEILDDLPNSMKRQPSFMLVRAIVFLSMGDTPETLRLFLEIERKNPRFLALYTPQALFYMEQGWNAHALKAAKRAQTDRDPDNGSRAGFPALIEEATEEIQSAATELGLSFENMLRASVAYERAQMAMLQDKLSEADYFYREAIKIAPKWNDALNARAQALYFTGKCEEAISISEAVLARDAENISALSHLVVHHYGLEHTEQARDYGNRLANLTPKLPMDSMEVDQVLQMLALIEDTPTLWEIAQRYLNAPTDSLFAESWACLAIAAIRSNQWKNAQKLLRKAGKDELPAPAVQLLEEINRVASQPRPRLAWMPPTYPGIELLFHPKVMKEWVSLTEKFSDPLSPSQKRKLDNFFQTYPFLVSAIKRLLWEAEGNPFALHILSEMDRPDMDAEILRFARSQAGSLKARMDALMQLLRLGRYTGSKIAEFWDDELQEWRLIKLSVQQIGPIEPNARPDTLALIEKSRKTSDPAQAISLLRKAVEQEPTCPIAIFNLGVLLVENDQVEEGEALFYHSVEVDPTYAYGHASIALAEADKGNEQQALDHLNAVAEIDIIAPETAFIASLAWMLLDLQKHDLVMARERYETAAKLIPDHYLLEHYEQVLQKAEEFDRKYGFLVNYERESTRRAHEKLLRTPLSAETDVRACLETYTKDMLVGIAGFYRTTSSGKKGELVSWLAKVVLDPEFLQPALEQLYEKERSALRWILETDGVRSWGEFVLTYGDDSRESKSWNDQEPKSIPGRLRVAGLLYSGVLEGKVVAFIPADLRPLLRKLLA
jgi:tetratricopeptide (TPR) repeat protein